MIKDWIIQMYDREIKDVKANISNQRTWQRAADSQESYDIFGETIRQLEEYLEVLETLKKQANEESAYEF